MHLIVGKKEGHSSSRIHIYRSIIALCGVSLQSMGCIGGLTELHIPLKQLLIVLVNANLAEVMREIEKPSFIYFAFQDCSMLMNLIRKHLLLERTN